MSLSIPWPRTPGCGRFACASDAAERSRDELFVHLLRALRPHGGLARAGELRQRHPGSADVALLAAAPVQFDFAGLTWFALFQFAPSSAEVRPSVRRVTDELGDVFDGWRLASWFTEPNAWLAGRAPVETLQHDLEAVCEAARADRYVAKG